MKRGSDGGELVRKMDSGDGVFLGDVICSTSSSFESFIRLSFLSYFSFSASYP